MIETTPAATGATVEPVGLLIDATRCIGCQECVRACKAEHGLPEPIGPDLNSTTYTVVVKRAGQYSRRLCMHCIDPTCVSVCPVAALRKQPGGQVTYDADACMGCRYCVFACPFNVPRYEWDKPRPVVAKSDLCVSRTSRGHQTACSWVCPMGATVSGPRSRMLAEARERIRLNPERYVDHVYGETEAGGTSVLILSGVPFDTAGYPRDVSQRPLPETTWRVLEKLPYVVLNGGIFLGGLAWIIHRRMVFQRHPELLDDLPPKGEKP
ncbi:MAG: 4Fe-4S dicluster domain-containing protein [Candidatus Wallbacteria bacterium]|nr:4Fe-4S dicluster domain-containing protein [Candidatus Wallbacteria bacterium]